VANGGSIQLSGSVNANATTPVTLAWTAGTVQGGTDLNGALTNANTTSPTFNATGLAAGSYNVRLTATNVAGLSSVDTTITVQPAPPPAINPIVAQTVNANTLVTMLATSNSLPAPTSFTWTQVNNGASVVALTTTTPASVLPITLSSQATFTPAATGTYLFDVVAKRGLVSSSPTRVTITVNAAVTQNIAITTAEYRTSNQRLVLAVTVPDLRVTSVILKPYLTEAGTMFDPATLGASNFTNAGGGLWNLTIVTAQRPACNLGGAYATPCSQRPLTVISTGGVTPGTSPATGLTRIR
jgi:predicted phage tail protein